MLRAPSPSSRAADVRCTRVRPGRRQPCARSRVGVAATASAQTRTRRRPIAPRLGREGPRRLTARHPGGVGYSQAEQEVAMAAPGDYAIDLEVKFGPLERI